MARPCGSGMRNTHCGITIFVRRTTPRPADTAQPLRLTRVFLLCQNITGKNPADFLPKGTHAYRALRAWWACDHGIFLPRMWSEKRFSLILSLRRQNSVKLLLLIDGAVETHTAFVHTHVQLDAVAPHIGAGILIDTPILAAGQTLVIERAGARLTL